MAIYEIYTSLSTAGKALISPCLVSEIIIAVAVVAAAFMIWKIAIPLKNSYKRATTLDDLVGSDERHWFYGHMRKYNGDETGLVNTIKRTKFFPNFFNYWMGPFFSVVILCHPTVIANMVTSKAPKTEMVYHFIQPWIGEGLITSKGKKWQRNRRLLTPAFHYNILKSYVKIFNETVQVMLDNWKDKVGTAVDISEGVHLLTLDALMQCVMSYKTGCQKSKTQHPIIRAVHSATTLLLKRITTPLYFFDFIFYRTADGKEFKKMVKILHDTADKVINERKKLLKSNKSRTNLLDDNEFSGINTKGKLDFLDILLQTRDEDGSGLTDKEIKDEVNTFMGAGYDTTASAVSFALFNLASHPKFQEKCREEIQNVLGEKEEIEWNDLSKLNYLTMFVKESMRLYPPVPKIGRKLNDNLAVKQDNKNKGAISDGTTVNVDIFLLHRNEKVWENPDEFNPERFSKENISQRSSYSFIPFSAGSRNCLGQNFALNEIKVILAQVLRKYRLYLDEDCPKPKLEAVIVLRSTNGIYMKFESLNSPSN